MIKDINDNQPHKVSEVICINCKYRWLAVRPTTTLLKNLECPRCHIQGYVIETGETIDT
jgi:uncharacterized paraquat-inducible protein A